jgi:molybdopterin/thiamine biosynthesis adenylyltransferase
MTITLVIPGTLASTLRDIVRLEVESGGVILARPVKAPNGDLRLLTTDFVPVPESAYEVRDVKQLLVTSSGYVPALGIAEIQGAIPLWFHSHPGDGSSPKPSRRDHHVDDELSALFRLRSGSIHYGSVIMSHEHGELRFTGHLDDGSNRVPIDRLLTVGPRFSLARSDLASNVILEPLFERNIRAFGGAVQGALADLCVGIVGCGGTGSSVAEQLVRLGVRNLVLIDPDRLSFSNLTRVYGSRAEDVGQLKVEIVARHLRGIAPDPMVETVPSTINVEEVARRLTAVDVVFGCTDDNAGRLVLSRLSTFMLVPVIDCGVLLSDVDGQLEGIYGRVTVLYPGSACLVCRNRVDLRRARTEMLAPEERRRRIDEGYAPALPGVEPAVVAYTTLVAAYAVGELLERLIGYGQVPAPSELVVRIHDREVSSNVQQPRVGHYCHPSSGRLGRGLTSPFLEQTWTA